ncbi:MAG: hypothetical protein K6D96_03590 [Acetatifactor sp.]|nr:hypothetical protein [Acetatifactor sp.]
MTYDYARTRAHHYFTLGKVERGAGEQETMIEKENNRFFEILNRLFNDHVAVP